LAEEQRHYGDLIRYNIEDGYANLHFKVFKWQKRIQNKKSSREKITVELQRQLKLKRILGIGDLVGGAWSVEERGEFSQVSPL
jgi:hypothetical protein